MQNNKTKSEISYTKQCGRHSLPLKGIAQPCLRCGQELTIAHGT